MLFSLRWTKPHDIPDGCPEWCSQDQVDHPFLPVTSPELVQTALACWQAGAQGLHAHIRNTDQSHLLDAGRYRELLSLIHI